MQKGGKEEEDGGDAGVLSGEQDGRDEWPGKEGREACDI